MDFDLVTNNSRLGPQEASENMGIEDNIIAVRKTIDRYKNHPSIEAISKCCRRKDKTLISLLYNNKY